MLQYVVKIFVSAMVIVAVSEIAKRHSGIAAFTASLPLTSLLAFVWLHLDGTPPARIAELSMQIFWLVIPSLAFFVALTLLLRYGLGFWASLGLSMVITAACYLGSLPLLRKLGVTL